MIVDGGLFGVVHSEFKKCCALEDTIVSCAVHVLVFIVTSCLFYVILQSGGKILQTRCKNYSKSICVPWPLTVKQAAKITIAQWKCATFQIIIYPTEEKNTIRSTSELMNGILIFSSAMGFCNTKRQTLINDCLRPFVSAIYRNFIYFFTFAY